MSKCMLQRVLTRDREDVVLEEGTIVYDMETKRIYYGDGVTKGGVAVMKEGEVN